jgi:hypothetical protein
VDRPCLVVFCFDVLPDSQTLMENLLDMLAVSID